MIIFIIRNKNFIMRTSLLLVFSVLIFNTQSIAQTNFYEDPSFNAIALTHNIIAILPFDATVTLRPRDMRDMTTKQLERMEITEGEGIQAAMYSWFLKRKKQGKLRIDVQPPNVTKAKLLRAGMTVEVIAAYTPQEICKLLGVDAIIMGTFETNKPMTQGTAIMLNAAFGVNGNTEKALINLTIYEGENGGMMCNYQKNIVGGVGSTTESLINILMRKASRRIAYTR